MLADGRLLAVTMRDGHIFETIDGDEIPHLSDLLLRDPENPQRLLGFQTVDTATGQVEITSFTSAVTALPEGLEVSIKLNHQSGSYIIEEGQPVPKEGSPTLSAQGYYAIQALVTAKGEQHPTKRVVGHYINGIITVRSNQRDVFLAQNSENKAFEAVLSLLLQESLQQESHRSPSEERAAEIYQVAQNYNFGGNLPAQNDVIPYSRELNQLIEDGAIRAGHLLDRVQSTLFRLRGFLFYHHFEKIERSLETYHTTGVAVPGELTRALLQVQAARRMLNKPENQKVHCGPYNDRRLNDLEEQLKSALEEQTFLSPTLNSGQRSAENEALPNTIRRAQADLEALNRKLPNDIELIDALEDWLNLSQSMNEAAFHTLRQEAGSQWNLPKNFEAPQPAFNSDEASAALFQAQMADTARSVLSTAAQILGLADDEFTNQNPMEMSLLEEMIPYWRIWQEQAAYPRTFARQLEVIGPQLYQQSKKQIAERLSKNSAPDPTVVHFWLRQLNCLQADISEHENSYNPKTKKTGSEHAFIIASLNQLKRMDLAIETKQGISKNLIVLQQWDEVKHDITTLEKYGHVPLEKWAQVFLRIQEVKTGFKDLPDDEAFVTKEKGQQNLAIRKILTRVQESLSIPLSFLETGLKNKDISPETVLELERLVSRINDIAEVLGSPAQAVSFLDIKTNLAEVRQEMMLDGRLED